MKLFFFLLLLVNITAHAQQDPALKGVRLEDIALFANEGFDVAGILAKRMKSYRTFYFDSAEKRVHINFLVEEPKPHPQDPDLMIVKVASLLETPVGQNTSPDVCNCQAGQFETGDPDNQFEFQINTLAFNKNADAVNFEILDKEVIPLADTKFKFEIGLKERALVATDENNPQLKFVMPVGVGALDLGVTEPGVNKIMTPYYDGQNLDTDLDGVSFSHRRDKSYYKNQPFIRFRTNESNLGGWSQIGLHIQQNPQFKRGFDSHGCMRLREEDLQTVFRVVMNTQNNRGLVNASIKLSLGDNELDHPMPKINNSIKVVANGGTRDNPKTLKDSDGLTKTESRKVTDAEFERIWRQIEADHRSGKARSINVQR